MVLYDTDTVNIALPNTSNMLVYQATLMSDDSEPLTINEASFPAVSTALQRLWTPMLQDEVKTTNVKRHGAAGPDGIKAAEWARAIKKVVLQRG